MISYRTVTQENEETGYDVSCSAVNASYSAGNQSFFSLRNDYYMHCELTV